MATVKKTKEPIVYSYEDLLNKAKASFMMLNDDQTASAVPEMTYPFKVKDSVVLGALPDCIIEEIIDNKILVISYHNKGERYGVPYDNGTRSLIASYWVHVEPIGVEQDTSFARPRNRYQTSTSCLDEIINNVYRSGVIDSPEYQRDYVWTLKDKQKLIKTIFNRNDIGKFLLMDHPYPECRLEIIDGKQRIRAIMDYLEGKFEYEGKTYYQLSRADKQAFSDVTVSVIKLQSDQIKKSDVLWLFLSINSGGVPQTEEHLTKVQAMYDQSIKEEQK